MGTYLLRSTHVLCAYTQLSFQTVMTLAKCKHRSKYCLEVPFQTHSQQIALAYVMKKKEKKKKLQN